MSEHRINFFSEDLSYQLEEADKTRQWIERIIVGHKMLTGAINYIFCSDEYLHQINLDYLAHDTYTDIITFDHSEEEFLITGDIYVSIDRVEDNAKRFNVPFEKELRRVMIHGILHLIGFGDHSDEEKEIMRKKEQESLNVFNT